MAHPRPFYYLENFCTALGWLSRQYGDLLNEPERGFMEDFHRLPQESAALLVRMLGRQGDLFRTGELQRVVGRALAERVDASERVADAEHAGAGGAGAGRSNVVAMDGQLPLGRTARKVDLLIRFESASLP